MNETKEVVVVEGQMDLCMSYQSGVHNTVAVSGTAFTNEHIHMIKRFCDKVILSFDTDQAGQSALKKTGLLCLLGGLDVYVVGEIGTKDPADLILENPDLWLSAVKKKRHIIEFLTDMVLALDIDDRAKGQRVVSDVLPFVRALTSPIDRSHFVRLISEKTHISQEILTEELARGILGGGEVTQEVETQSIPPLERLTKEIIAFAKLHNKANHEEYVSLSLDIGLFPESIIEEEMFSLEKKVLGDKEAYFRDLMSTYRREEHRAELVRLQKKLKEEGADLEAIMRQIYDHMRKLV
jgi:DNA primase